MTNQFGMTREEYLTLALKMIQNFQVEETQHQQIPKVRVSCGLPTRKQFGAKRVIGQCWSSEASADLTHEIFISPTISKAQTVIATLIHEYCHALAGIKAGHGKAFKRIANAMGLTGPMTTTSLDDDMQRVVEKWVNRLGEYPHADLTGKTDGTKKQGTRMIKAECPGCGYTIRTTKKWIIEKGLPTCPCGETFHADLDLDDEEG